MMATKNLLVPGFNDGNVNDLVVLFRDVLYSIVLPSWSVTLLLTKNPAMGIELTFSSKFQVKVLLVLLNCKLVTLPIILE